MLHTGPANHDPVADVHHLGIEPIQLQEFLDMTNIHFMELTTTKRRHTLAHGSRKKHASNATEDGSGKGISLDDRVTAGFCIVPMLELYQHVRVCSLNSHASTNTLF
jgi:kinetochore protein Spc7/SPC105